jgi:hypothetical protein
LNCKDGFEIINVPRSKVLMLGIKNGKNCFNYAVMVV